MGPNGAVLVRERVGQIGREAIDRVREEMKQLGQKIAECKDQGIETGNTMDGERGRLLKAQRSNLKSDRVHSL